MGVLQAPSSAQEGLTPGTLRSSGHCAACAHGVARTASAADDIGWRPLQPVLRPRGLRRARFALRGIGRGCATRVARRAEAWLEPGGIEPPTSSFCERPPLIPQLKLMAPWWPALDVKGWRLAICAILQSAPRSSQETVEIAVFRGHLPGTSLVCRGGEPISSSSVSPHPPAKPPSAMRARFSTSFLIVLDPLWSGF